jgi:ribonuclease HII
VKTIVKSVFEKKLEREGRFAGVDEVGVTSIAGPLIACAVVMAPDSEIQGIRDSKEIHKHEERVRLAKVIQVAALDYAIGTVSSDEVSKLGTVKASKEAMARAVLNLSSIPNRVVTDYHKLDLPYDIQQHNIVKADAKIYSVACASIVAKVYRDTYMKQLHEKFPMYGWITNVGYRSREHWAAIRKHGLTPHHRTKYAKVWTPEQVAEYRRQKARKKPPR